MRKSDKSRRRKTKKRRERRKNNCKLITRNRSEYKILDGNTVLVGSELRGVLLNTCAEVQIMRVQEIICLPHSLSGSTLGNSIRNDGVTLVDLKSIDPYSPVAVMIM